MPGIEPQQNLIPKHINRPRIDILKHKNLLIILAKETYIRFLTEEDQKFCLEVAVPDFYFLVPAYADYLEVLVGFGFGGGVGFLGLFLEVFGAVADADLIDCFLVGLVVQLEDAAVG